MAGPSSTSCIRQALRREAAVSQNGSVLGARRTLMLAASRRIGSTSSSSGSIQQQQHHQQQQRMSAQRRLHSLPPLPENLREVKSCEPLFSGQTLRLLWNSWHNGLLSKLNDEVRGTKWEHASVAETVIGTARDPHKIQAFNYASLALNHSFFLSNLKPKALSPGVSHWEDEAPPKPPRDLAADIEAYYESVPAFKLAFSSMAYGMSGSGYVWLVRDKAGQLGIVPTYGAGTILIQNRMQRNAARSDWILPSVEEQPTSSAAPNTSQAQQQQQQPGRSFPPSQQASSPTTSSPAGSRPFSMTHAPSADIFNERYSRDLRPTEGDASRGEELYPLLCVSVHERDWLPDYGMWGKEEYLMRFWECVDWTRVYRLWRSYKDDLS